MLTKFKCGITRCLTQYPLRFSTAAIQIQEHQRLVQQTYKDLVDLSSCEYPSTTFKQIEDLETGYKYARSSLGLWGLQTAFNKGVYKVKTTDFKLIEDEKAQHSQFASHVESEYLFTQDENLKEQYCRLGGRSLRYGKIIEELDAMAGDCSYKYLMKNDDPATFDPNLREYYLVTVSVDRVDFMTKLSASRDLKLSAYMMMAKGSTLMVKIDVLQRSAGEQGWEQVGDAVIIFVARNAKTGKSYKVPDMAHSRFDDVARTMKCIEIGLTIKDWSRDKSQRDMHSLLPDYEESAGFNHYLEQVERQKRINETNVISMSETERVTILLMHGQDRNRHGKIFGGYLMRQAFDISWITATVQGEMPELLRVDQVLFLKPVPVGSIVEFRSKVTLIQYVEGVGHVMRVVTKAFNEFKEQTNNFNFLFVVKDPNYKRFILPETFDDILDYHEAQRRLSYEGVQKHV